MTLSHFSLLALLCATPAILFDDSLLVHGLLGVCLALVLAYMAWEIRSAEAAHVWRVLRLPAAACLVPALAMLVQMLPLPSRVSHSVWSSAAEALDRPLAGTVTIDPGATLMALEFYLTGVAMILLTAAVASDRRRAESLTRFVGALAGALSILLVVDAFAGSAVFRSNPAAKSSLLALADLGAVAAFTAVLRVLERFDARSENPQAAREALLGAALPCLSLAACMLALVREGTLFALLVTGCALGALACLAALRRFSARRFEIVASGVLLLALLGGAVFALSAARHGAPSPPARVSAILERTQAETGWLGSGAGTLPAVLTLYGSGDEGQSAGAVPSAVRIAVEMGRPAWTAFVLLALAASAVLLVGAWRRGRDAPYAAMGAVVIAMQMAGAYANSSLLTASVTMVTAALVGIACAQSAGRSAEKPDAPQTSR